MKSFALAALMGMISGAQLYDHVKSDVTIYSNLNFEKQVTKGREKEISIVHFYKSTDGKSEEIVSDYNQFATDNKGVFRIGSVDCDDFANICKKEGVTEFPTIKVYPPFPVPTSNFDMGDKLDVAKLKKTAGKFINDKSIEITNSNHKTFVEEDVGVPKVLLFTNAKKGTPFVYKVLSQRFEKTLQFGLVRESEDALAKKYKVKKYPSLVVVKNEMKPIHYESADFKYQPIFEFLNIHSQIFVDPNAAENVVKTNSASKPWLVKPVPEMTKDSGNDICLQKDGALCIIYLVGEKSQVDEKVIEEMDTLGQNFASKISRGIQFHFSYLDASREPEFASIFAVESYPSMVVLNPGKRKRFLLHDGELNGKAIETTLDKILGGDAKFKVIKGNKLPELVSDFEDGNQIIQ